VSASAEGGVCKKSPEDTTGGRGLFVIGGSDQFVHFFTFDGVKIEEYGF
jgi:hypothetical protein